MSRRWRHPRRQRALPHRRAGARRPRRRRPKDGARRRFWRRGTAQRATRRPRTPRPAARRARPRHPAASCPTGRWPPSPLVTLPVVWMGYGTDLDVAALKRTGALIRDLDYQPSRTPGVPRVRGDRRRARPARPRRHQPRHRPTTAVAVVGSPGWSASSAGPTATSWPWPSSPPPSRCPPPVDRRLHVRDRVLRVGGLVPTSATAASWPGCSSRWPSAAAARRSSDRAVPLADVWTRACRRCLTPSPSWCRRPGCSTCRR